MHGLRIPDVCERGRITRMEHSQELVPHELSLQLLIPHPRRHQLVLIHCKHLMSKVTSPMHTSNSRCSSFNCCRLASMFCLREPLEWKFSPGKESYTCAERFLLLFRSASTSKACASLMRTASRYSAAKASSMSGVILRFTASWTNESTSYVPSSL
jgi:hypothetical protein